jgi:Putative peptidoglycan binding domain
MEILYPMFYGTRLVTFDVLRNTFEPHMHPEAAYRGFMFILSQGGNFGIGGGYRPPGTQPVKAGFAPPGKSFHEGQQFPSGLFYAAWDLVVVNPDGLHRQPRWEEVPVQGSSFALDCGMHMNVPGEPHHMQPIELDGWDSWVNRGRFDLEVGRRVIPPDPVPDPIEPPEPPIQPLTEGVVVEFTSRNLIQGCSGTDVKFFQRLLNDVAGQGLTLDGNFGPMTAQAVRNWQTFFPPLTVDGELGPHTQQSIIEIALQT